MRMMKTLGRAVLGLVAAMLVSVAPVRAVDTVIIGTVGSPSANLWPLFIGIDKGFFTAANVKVDLIYIPASANAIQQLAAGALDMSFSTGLVDPGRRARCGARHRALRNPGAALCIDREIEHQEPQRPQGQSDLGRRPEGHYSHLCRSYAGAERAQGRRL